MAYVFQKVCSGCQTTHSTSQTAVSVQHHQEVLSHRLFILDIVRHLTDSWPRLLAGCVAVFSHVIAFGTLCITPTSLSSYWAPGPVHAVFGDVNPFLRPSPSLSISCNRVVVLRQPQRSISRQLPCLSARIRSWHNKILPIMKGLNSYCSPFPWHTCLTLCLCAF